MSNNKQSGDVLVNIDEASKITNYSLHTLYQKVSQNQIPYIKKTGEKRLWFNKEELLNYRKKPSQNKKNKVKNEMRDSEKLSDAQKNFVMRAILEYWQTLPWAFGTVFIEYGATKQNQTIKTMTNNKQSSIEWLINKCACADLRPELWNIIKEQAKAMHKEEIKAAFNQGYRDGEHDDGNTTHILGDVSVWDDSENYYNETFGGNK